MKRKPLKIPEHLWVKSMKTAQKDKQERVLDNLKVKGRDRDGGTFTDAEARQPKALRTKTLKNLRDEAKELGLSTGGTKISIYNRINEHNAGKARDSIVMKKETQKEMKNSAVETINNKINIVTSELDSLQRRVNEIHNSYTAASERRDDKLHELERLKITSQNLKDIL